MINRRLQYYLETEQFYTSTQSEFRAVHNTLYGLVRLQHTSNDEAKQYENKNIV